MSLETPIARRESQPLNNTIAQSVESTQQYLPAEEENPNYLRVDEQKYKHFK